MAIWSRLPLDDFEVQHIVQEDIPSFHATLRLRDGAGVRIHCLHPRPPAPQEGDTSAPRDAELVVMANRIREAREARESEGPAKPPHIVLGDLNDVAWSRTTELFLKISGMLDPRRGRGLYNSFHAEHWWFRVPLDHVFVSPEFRLIDMRRLDYVGSDHYPMCIEVALEPDADAQQSQEDGRRRRSRRGPRSREGADRARGKRRRIGPPLRLGRCRECREEPVVNRALAYGVHLLTASGIACMFLAAAEIARPLPRPWLVFVYFLIATVIDGVDGPLARKFAVKTYAKNISGRTIDDIVDYLGFTFLPMLLVWRMGWLPGESGGVVGGVVVVLVMMASLLGFAHSHAKDETAGFFRGFPSYWNLVAIYNGFAAALLGTVGEWLNVVVLLALALLTVLPVWMVYPNLAPPKWKPIVLVGSYLWAIGLMAMLPWFPDRVPGWLVLLSLAFPAFYLWLSWHLRARWPQRDPPVLTSDESARL